MKAATYFVSVTNLLTQSKLEELRQVEAKRLRSTDALRKLGLVSPRDRYDLEYCNSNELSSITGDEYSFDGTHYWFWSPILEPEVLGMLIGRRAIGSLKILDVGAGNGTLLKKLHSLGATPLLTSGVDVSQTSVIRIKETGASASTVNPIRPQHYDLIFLSYFVDRDEDQEKTFTEACANLAPLGTIALEGLFPCVLEDSSQISYGTANITQGRDANEDINLIVAEFAKLGMVFDKLMVGKRLVYSIDGPEILSSHILVFNKP